MVKHFPMDGFADTCIGHGRPPHGADYVDDQEVLCGECSTALLVECNERSARSMRERRAAQCPGGCRDHEHGTRYHDCLCCYGD